MVRNSHFQASTQNLFSRQDRCKSFASNKTVSCYTRFGYLFILPNKKEREKKRSLISKLRTYSFSNYAATHERRKHILRLGDSILTPNYSLQLNINVRCQHIHGLTFLPYISFGKRVLTRHWCETSGENAEAPPKLWRPARIFWPACAFLMQVCRSLWGGPHHCKRHLPGELRVDWQPGDHNLKLDIVYSTNSTLFHFALLISCRIYFLATLSIALLGLQLLSPLFNELWNIGRCTTFIWGLNIITTYLISAEQ